MVDNPSSKKRWYDQQATVSKSVTLMERFPSEFQQILGESVIELAETQCRVDELMAQLRSIGPEKVLSLFKSKSKRRASDKLQEVHQALNYMYILPDGERIFLANHIIGIVNYFYEYFKICKEERVQPSANIARQVCKAYIQGDLNDPNIFLTIVRQQIQVSTHFSFEYGNPLNLAEISNILLGEDIPEVVLEETDEPAHAEKLNASRDGLFIRKIRPD